ncbi:MAG: tRNA (adenosine(37)-N6)-threonylcarbamoyltransferase complex transferase subunit TsaD, partial [Pseudomonadota bacterium]|nr:tRNA (adenosine(37)-N6)-threonylcarbamoyltransferase complex transferase subunit TsaD [Pseudomonadota bacterium]
DRMVADALAEAGCKLGDMDAVAATAGPGLIGGVLIGLTTGKALALASGAPFYGINHLEGHALTARLTHNITFPYLLLLVSGGHCQLCRVDGVGDYTLLGTTRDDAVGEAFDKAAKLLGLGYPGGPEIEARAAQGDEQRFALPRPLVGHDASGCDFSFSGLKTALRQRAIELQPISETDICDLAAGFQAAIADCLVDRCRVAMNDFDVSDGAGGRLVVAGGVAANQFLRQALDEITRAAGFSLTVPPPALCTDNGAMIAWAGAERLHAGSTADTALAAPARARWPLSENEL